MKRSEETGKRLTGVTSRNRLLRAVSLSERLLLRRLQRALSDEDEIDALLLLTQECAAEEGMNEKARRELLSRVETLRCEDLSKLCSIIGLLCEKELLLRKGETGRDTQVATPACRFEEL